MFYAIPTEPVHIKTVWDDNGNKWERVNDRYWETDEDECCISRSWEDMIFHHGPLTSLKPVEAGDMVHPDDSSQYTFKQNTVVVTTDKNRAYQYIGNRWQDTYGLKFDDLENFTGDLVTVVFVP